MVPRARGTCLDPGNGFTLRTKGADELTRKCAPGRCIYLWEYVCRPMRTLRLQLRFLLPLLATLIAAAWLAAPIFDQLIVRWFARDLASRGILVANALSDSIADAVLHDRVQRLGPLFDRAVEDER